MRGFRVLGIGYAANEYDAEKTEWVKHGILFDFAESISQAEDMLHGKAYVCVVIRSERITADEIAALRKVRPVSVVILHPVYSIAEAHICAHLSAVQYIRMSGLDAEAGSSKADSFQRVLELPPNQREALTIITVKDHSFCLE